MTIPVTYSAPGSHKPSAKDSLREGVYLMLMADDANRKIYSYDDDDPSKGVRIASRVAYTDNTAAQRIVVPQQIVSVALGSGKWEFQTSNAGEETIHIAVMHLEAPTTDYIDVNVAAPELTPESKLARTQRILFRGTLYDSERTSEKGRVVDPYNSPLLEDGTYDPDTVRFLNSGPPQIAYSSPRVVPLRTPRSESEFFAIDPVRDLAVAYVLIAMYRVTIIDRDA